MRKSNRVTGLILGLMLLFAGPVFAANHNVTVGRAPNGQAVLAYFPAQLTINAGDTVTFTNALGLHNVVADNGSFRCALGCDGVGSGNGNPSSNNWSVTITYNVAGTFGYHCDIHGSPGSLMFGTVTVLGTTPPPPPPPPPPAVLGPGFTGLWYNPAQDGHGVFLEVLPDNRMVAAWYVFTPGSQQAWVVGVGTITGNTAAVDVVITSGTAFPPNFNAAQVVRTPWGRLNFTFTDCNTGRMDYVSTVSGFGSGSIPLTRVTMPAGLTCTPPLGAAPLE